MIKDKSIFIKNIYYMLSYAFSNLHEAEYKNVEKESFSNIDNLFAAILAKGISKQLKQGLYREYVPCHEDLPTVYGKIDMAGTIRNQLACRKLVACNFDELSADNLYNQILKSTAWQLAQSEQVDRKYRDQLKQELLLFNEVKMADLSKVNWHSLNFYRYNQSYRLLLGICELLAEGKILTTEQGMTRIADFADDQRMSHLYEKFILEYYAQEYAQKYPGFTAKASYIPWQLDDDNKHLLPVMKSDVILSYGGRKMVIDAKYYTHSLQSNFALKTIHSGNLYQIFTYVKNLAAAQSEDVVAGLLLYAKTDEKLVPDEDYQMDGNQISVKTLDLGQDFAVIKEQLDKVVKEFFTELS